MLFYLSIKNFKHYQFHYSCNKYWIYIATRCGADDYDSPFVPTAEHPAVRDEACGFFDFFFYHMKSFRFFGPARETTEEGDDVRGPPRRGENSCPGW